MTIDAERSWLVLSSVKVMKVKKILFCLKDMKFDILLEIYQNFLKREEEEEHPTLVVRAQTFSNLCSFSTPLL